MKRLFSVVLTIVLLSAPALSSTDPISDEEIKTLLKNLPNTMFGVDPTDHPTVQSIDLPVDSYLAEAKSRCANVTSVDAYYSVGNEIKNLNTCLANLINFDTLGQEIELKSKTGDLDEVFNVYCGKRHTVLPCIQNFLTALDGCLETDEKKAKNIGYELFTTMIGFVCYKEGDHIALFIAEKGPECFEENKDGLQKCTENFVDRYRKEGDSNWDVIRSLLTNLCVDMPILQQCMVGELEKCETTTPANLVDAAFRLITKECKKRT